MSTLHSKAARRFNENREKTTWHDATFWALRQKRDQMAKGLDEWEQLREHASQIKRHTITHLADYQEQFAAQLESRGVKKKLFVIHQTGAADESFVKECYAKAGIPARVQAFEREMGRAFASADLVVCRAGASTIFELALVGKPAFLIPLPSAMRNHQHFNAMALVDKGAADEGIQESLTPRSIANYILNKAEHPELLEKKSAAMKAAATPDAAARVADILEQVCC